MSDSDNSLFITQNTFRMFTLTRILEAVIGATTAINQKPTAVWCQYQIKFTRIFLTVNWLKHVRVWKRANIMQMSTVASDLDIYDTELVQTCVTRPSCILRHCSILRVTLRHKRPYRIMVILYDLATYTLSSVSSFIFFNLL